MSYYDSLVDINELVGKTFIKIDNNDDELIFHGKEGTGYKFYHDQNCCESVYIEDVIGDLNDLLNTEILSAEEVASETKPDDIKRDYEPASETWTFYKFATAKGRVTVRWCGSSNGYYSESVSIRKL